MQLYQLVVKGPPCKRIIDEVVEVSAEKSGCGVVDCFVWVVLQFFQGKQDALALHLQSQKALLASVSFLELAQPQRQFQHVHQTHNLLLVRTCEKILEALNDFQLDDQHVEIQLLLHAHVAVEGCNFVPDCDLISFDHLFESVNEAIVLKEKVDVIEVASCDVTQTQASLSPYDHRLVIQHLFQGFKRIILQQILHDFDPALRHAAHNPYARHYERIFLVIGLSVQDLYALNVDIGFYYLRDLCFSDLHVIRNAPQTVSKVRHVFNSALGQGETKSDHQFLDLIVLRKWITSANVSNGQSYDLLELCAFHFLQQLNENPGCALVEQLIPEGSVVADHVGKEPHDLIDKVIAEFEKVDEGRDALAAGNVLVERRCV